MTPEEKAIELVDKFYFIEESQECDAWIDRYLAKKCALLAVDYIITSNPHSNPFNTDVYSTMSYWKEVKTEIEKL